MRWCPALPPCPPLYLASHPVQSSLTSRVTTTATITVQSDLSLTVGPGRSMWHPPPPHPAQQEQYRSHHSKSDSPQPPSSPTPNTTALKCSPSHTIFHFLIFLPICAAWGFCWVTNISLRRPDLSQTSWEIERRIFPKIKHILYHFIYKV